MALPKSLLALIVLPATGLTVAIAQTGQGARTIPARLDCGALSPSSKTGGSFTAPLTFTLDKGALTAEREPISVPGKEDYRGTVDPLGRIKLSGSYSGRGAWQYRFVGQLSDKKSTVLVGELEVTNGAVGKRDCTITLLPKPDELLALFSY